MSNRVHQWLASVDRLINWFIPAEMNGDRETRKQARMFLISHLFGPFIGNVVPLALYMLDPTPGFDVAVLAGSITAFWVFPFVLRAAGRYNLLVLLSVQNLIFCILWSCYFYGGVTSPTLPWVLTIPLLAFFYIGPAPRLQLIVLGLFAANLTAFWSLYVLGHSVPNDMPAASVQGLGIVSTVAASLYVTMMAFYYAKILASGVELENEMKLHLATAAELRTATSSAERAGAAKSEFLAKMSHELRTPLNAVIGYSEMLLEDAAAEGDADAAADLDKIHGAGQHLLRLVNQVLDLSKIEAGKMELFTETLDVSETVRDAVESCRDLAEKKGNDLTVKLDDELGTMTGDEKKLRQVIAQLLDNAAKFTHNGRITVTARRMRDVSGDEIIVAVQDTGIGIAPEIMPTLFENFSVGEDLTSSKYGGTGLGLALSQKLCKLMGGELSAESTPAVGSCFTLRVPTLPPEPSVSGRESDAGIDARHDGSGPPTGLAQAA
jgi:signal transduction histidine kinase